MAGCRLLQVGLIVGMFSVPCFAQMQPGSTGGSIGKADKSISGGGEPSSPHRAVPSTRSRSGNPGGEEKPHKVSSGCGRIVGAWRWALAQTITFGADGSTESSRGDSGNWTCENGRIVARWKSGYIDSIMLSADGTELSFTNNVFGSYSGIHREK